MTTVEVTQSISLLAEEYQKAIENIKSKRDIWENTTHTLLNKTLTDIANSNKIGWHVQDFGMGRNLDTVNISFGPNNSGLVVKDEKGTKALVKHGGYLAFSTMYNGDISVYLSYPYVDEHMQRIPVRQLDRISPESITVEYIVSMTKLFLAEMLAWEKGEKLKYGN